MSGTIPITSASASPQQTTPAAGGTIQNQIAQAELLLKNGDSEGAENVARAALATDANELELHSILLKSLYYQGKQLELEAAARDAIAATPASSNDELAEFHLALSFSLEAQGRVPEAEAAVREAMKADPADPNLKACVHLQLAALLHAQGRIAEERVELQAAQDAGPTDDRLKKSLPSRITQIDSSSTPQQQAARSIQAQGARTFTIQLGLASLAPPNPRHYTPQSASASPQQTTPAAGGTIQDQIAQAALLLKNGDSEGAERVARAGLATDASALELQNILLRSLHAQGKQLELEAAARAAIAATPASSNDRLAEFHYALSVSLKARGRISEAEAAVRDAMAADPNPNCKAQMHAQLAHLLRLQSRSVEERVELRAALDAGPTDDILKKFFQSRITELDSSSTPQQQAASSIQAGGARAFTGQQGSASAPAVLAPLNNSRHYIPQSPSASAAAVVERTPAGEEVTCPMMYADQLFKEFRAEMRGEFDALKGILAELESQTNGSGSSSAEPPAAQAAESARRGSKRRPDAAPSAANPPADKRNKAASEED